MKIILALLLATGITQACEPVPSDRIDTIASGVSTSVTEAGYAVKSKDYKQVYFVSIKATSGDVLMFATNSIKDNGITFSADEFTAKVAQWPQGRPGMGDHGFTDAFQCAM